VSEVRTRPAPLTAPVPKGTPPGGSPASASVTDSGVTEAGPAALDQRQLAAAGAAKGWLPFSPARGLRRMTDPFRRLRPGGGILATLGLASVWALGFGWLAVQRHLAGGSHAEDLGFTDQVLANFLRGQFFRMSIYQGGTWNTEMDLSRLARPDSLMAFHFEPVLLLLVPLYAVGGGATLLLIIQALAVAAGAGPAYRLGAYASGSSGCGLAIAMTYLLSPLGQWAVLADFHTATLAAPLLVLTVERLVVKHSAAQALAVAGLAATTREDVGPAIAALGLVLLVLRGHACLRTASSSPAAAARPSSCELSVTTRRHAGRHAQREKRQAGVMAALQSPSLTGLAFVGLGLGSSLVAALVIRSYSGGGLPFEVRYGATLGSGPAGALAALGRPTVLGYLGTLALSGGWLGLLAPLTVLPALPSIALNILSASPWMAAGKAHYSSLVLPFITIAAAASLQRLRGRGARLRLATGALVLSSVFGYLGAGAGPLGGNYAPAVVGAHARRADSLAQGLPVDAAVSASSALVPRVSRRPRVYVFPAVLDADYVFVDLRAGPAPTSAGDIFLRVRMLLANGGWKVESAEDGLLLLRRAADAEPTDIRDLSTVLDGPGGFTVPGVSRVPPSAAADVGASTLGNALDGRVSLLSASLLPSPDAAIDVDGPRGVLRTVWRAEQPLPGSARVDFWLELRSGEQLQVWDVATLWWNPPTDWTPGEPVTFDIPEVPMREFLSWQAIWTAETIPVRAA